MITQLLAFIVLGVAAWWAGPFPHSEPIEAPDLFDPEAKSWFDHRHHMHSYDPLL